MRQTVNVMRLQGGKVVKMGRPTCEAECRAQMATELWRAGDYRRLTAASRNDLDRKNYAARARFILGMMNTLRRGLADHLTLAHGRGHSIP